MTEKQYIELINKEVDGLLSEKEKDQLQNYLEKDPKAKSLYQEINKTSDMRKFVDDIDPSTNLKKGILNTIDINRYASEHRTNFLRLTISDWYTRLNPKLVYAFAAGVIIGLIMYSVFLTEAIQDQPLDNIKFYGTIGIPENANISQLDQVTLDFPEVTGTVGFYKFDDIIWFEIDMTNSDRCTIAFKFDPTKIIFDSFKPLKHSINSVGNKKNIVTLTVNENGHFLLLFRQNSTENTQINLQITPATEAPFKYNFQFRSKDRKSDSG
jgi:hypothetical protein